MTFTPSTVLLPDLTLIVVRAQADAEPPIKAAWRILESRLSTLKGRRFYGVCQNEGAVSVYYAGLAPLNEDEIILLGLPTLSVKRGRYARIMISDWPKHTDQIGSMMEQLKGSFRMDPARPSLEHYRSNSELFLLAPLLED